MPAWLQFPFVFGVPLLPARRVIALDPGTHSIKVVVAEVFLDRFRVLRRLSLERETAGAASVVLAANREKLHQLLRGLGQYPLALALPQHVVLSQAIDLPRVAEAAVQQLIQNEAMKLAGLSQTRVAWDSARLKTYGRHDHAFWITLCQENEVSAMVEELALQRDELCDVTSVGNAMRVAYLRLFPETQATVLVNLGVRSTTVAFLLDGQGLYVTSFGLGTELFAEALANHLRCPHEKTAVLLRENNYLAGPAASRPFTAAVENWRQELLRIAQEWIADHQDSRLGQEGFQYVICGGGARTPGLVDYLNQQAGAHFQLWPEAGETAAEDLPGYYAVAEGAAIQALGKNAQSASLLPGDLRQHWQNQRAVQKVQSLCFLLLLVLSLLLGVGAWQKVVLEGRKFDLLAQTDAALDKAEKSRRISRKLHEDFERIKPLVERQKHTSDILLSLTRMQAVRSNQNYWLVLFGDDQSYFGAPSTGGTNETVTTNAVGTVVSTAPALANTPRRPGLVAEVCIPGDSEGTRRALSQIVRSLKQDARFKNVDTIAPEQRRPLADAKSLVPDRHFALFLELAPSAFDTFLLSGRLESVSPGGAPPALGPILPAPITLPGESGGKP